MKMELEKIGSRHRDSTNHFAAESEALDQIAKEVSVDLIPNSISIIVTLWTRNIQQSALCANWISFGILMLYVID